MCDTLIMYACSSLFKSRVKKKKGFSNHVLKLSICLALFLLKNTLIVTQWHEFLTFDVGRMNVYALLVQLSVLFYGMCIMAASGLDERYDQKVLPIMGFIIILALPLFPALASERLRKYLRRLWKACRCRSLSGLDIDAMAALNILEAVSVGPYESVAAEGSGDDIILTYSDVTAQFVGPNSEIAVGDLAFVRK